MLAQQIKSEAQRLGFDLVGIAPAVSPPGFVGFRDWLERGFAGGMSYLPRREAAYEHPRHVLESVRSVVMLGLNYRTAEPQSLTAGQGLVSRFAWGDADYHDVIRDKLARLAEWLQREVHGCRTRGVVDTAPLLERDFARLAGLGWFGKNTMLLNKRVGSWFFLAALLTDVELEPDASHVSQHCGTCTRCLDACPTEAFVAPYQLDARRCISYLTIEHRGAIPHELRSGMGEWLFGCDVCQDVCPWNHKAPVSTEPTFQPADDLHPANAIKLLSLDEAEFRDRFRHTPLARPKRSGILRNAAIVLGNRGDACAVPALTHALHDYEPIIRGAAAWALGRLGGVDCTAALLARQLIEVDAEVQAEIRQALPDSIRVETSRVSSAGLSNESGQIAPFATMNDKTV
ncbi:MAG: tRNA epoxyqueuosine(34) reductase QueG [Planctomycetales bacterium]|nr:tRNA epoxyqueuosine(34) reductase QueG [Planctomycetales bacterium]